MQSDLINKYLLERGLWKPVSGISKGESNDILDDPDKLAQVAGLFETFAKPLAWVLEEKIKKMALELIREAVPQEVIIIRQNMIEVSSIYDELEQYSIEYTKRKEAKENASGEATPNNEDNVQEPPSDNGSAPEAL